MLILQISSPLSVSLSAASGPLGTSQPLCFLSWRRGNLPGPFVSISGEIRLHRILLNDPEQLIQLRICKITHIAELLAVFKLLKSALKASV